MDQVTSKRVKQNGVEIAITLRGGKFDVSIEVTPDMDFSKRYKCKHFAMDFELLNGEAKLYETLHFQTKNRKYKKGIVSNGLTLFYEKEGYYRCRITLFPHLYVTPEYLERKRAATAERKQKAKRAEQNKKFNMGSIRRPGMSSQRVTRYSQNNAGHPYAGGRCSSR